jgi:hypothetical protein
MKPAQLNNVSRLFYTYSLGTIPLLLLSEFMGRKVSFMGRKKFLLGLESFYWP